MPPPQIKLLEFNLVEGGSPLAIGGINQGVHDVSVVDTWLCLLVTFKNLKVLVVLYDRLRNILYRIIEVYKVKSSATWIDPCFIALFVNETKSLELFTVGNIRCAELFSKLAEGIAFCHRSKRYYCELINEHNQPIADWLISNGGTLPSVNPQGWCCVWYTPLILMNQIFSKKKLKKNNFYNTRNDS